MTRAKRASKHEVLKVNPSTYPLTPLKKEREKKKMYGAHGMGS
jgi:hypothetical protein